jgi:hypothetical protein
MGHVKKKVQGLVVFFEGTPRYCGSGFRVSLAPWGAVALVPEVKWLLTTPGKNQPSSALALTGPPHKRCLKTILPISRRATLWRVEEDSRPPVPTRRRSPRRRPGCKSARRLGRAGPLAAAKPLRCRVGMIRRDLSVASASGYSRPTPSGPTPKHGLH